MIIRDIRWEPNGRLEANVHFETSGATQSIVFNSPGIQSAPFFASHPFIAASYLPALLQGEERMVVEASYDPSLSDNLEVVRAHASHWWSNLWGPVPRINIEGEQKRLVAIPTCTSAASFFTGGLDSLYTLHKNLNHFPAGHSWRIGKAILCYGLDAGLGGMDFESNEEKTKFRELEGTLRRYLDGIGIELISVETNVRCLKQDNDFYVRHFHGGYLASVAHLLSGVSQHFRIGSSFDVPNLFPWGSHPSTDTNYSDVAVGIRHDGIEASRIEKLRSLIKWGVDLSILHVCYVNPMGRINCGECNKCRRSIVELLAAGAQDQAQEIFGMTSVSSALTNVTVRSGVDRIFLSDARDAFNQQGSNKEASVLTGKLSEYDASRRRVEERDWRGGIKRVLRQLGVRR